MTRKQKQRIVIAGILVALPALFLVEEHFRGKWALTKLKRQLEAKGEKLAVNDCRPPAPQSAENSYAELIRAASMLGGSSLTMSAPRSFRAVAPGRVEVVYNLTEWNVSSSASRRSATNNNWQRLEESFAAWRDPLDEVKAAIRKPVCDYNVDYARGFDAPLLHLTRVRSAAQHLGVDALIHLHHGQLDGAIEDIESMLWLSHQMRNERLMICQLVRMSIAALAVGPTWQTLQTPGLTDARLARLQRAWETNEFLVAMNQSIEMERAMMVAMFDRARGSANEMAKVLDSFSSAAGFGAAGASGPAQSFDQVIDRVGEGGSQMVLKGLYVPLWQFAWSCQDETFYLEGMQEELAECREAVKQYSMAPMSNSSKRLERRWAEQSHYDKLTRPFSRSLASPFANSFRRAAAMEAQRALVTTAIVLKRHELRHGTAPATLTALVPEFLREPPRDIFDGQPLRYLPRDGGRCLLYSIGKDEHDDGGDPSPPDDVKSRATPNLYFTNGRDWVWPMPASEEEIRAAEEKEQQRK
jgi:hypothetical protein